MNQEEKQLHQLFQEKKAFDSSTTPTFSTIFGSAQRQYRAKQRNRFFLMVACISVLTIIGFAINDDTLPVNMEKITIAKGSIHLFEKLMADGKIVTNDIHFEYDKSVIKPSSFKTLQEIGTMLKENSKIHLRIEGHTDNSGASDYNLKLSSSRAEAVRVALIKMGVNSDRLMAQGLGESQPINLNKTEAERVLNRRVEFVLIK